jgi:hypothetical protein
MAKIICRIFFVFYYYYYFSSKNNQVFSLILVFFIKKKHTFPLFNEMEKKMNYALITNLKINKK